MFSATDQRFVHWLGCAAALAGCSSGASLAAGGAGTTSASASEIAATRGQSSGAGQPAGASTSGGAGGTLTTADFAAHGGTSAPGPSGGSAAVGGTAPRGGAAAPAPAISGAGAPAAGSGGSGTPGGRFQCPAGPFGTPLPPSPQLTRVPGMPPLDAFNDQGNTSTNLEGPVWIDGKLYLSEFPFVPTPGARILAFEPATGTVSVALAQSGSNGLAVDAGGALIATDHVQGAVERIRFPLGTPEVLAAGYAGQRFDSPNDLAVRSDGTIFFSDPDYQAPSMRPQPKTRVYRLAPGAREPQVIDEMRSQPNGVTLCADERTLYVAGTDGIFAYALLDSGEVGPGMRLAAFGGGSDGMGMDCAGNLYATSNQRVVVLDPRGQQLGVIEVPEASNVTNVAFGGPAHKTLFITAMGSGTQRGLFQVELQVPGLPY